MTVLPVLVPVTFYCSDTFPFPSDRQQERSYPRQLRVAIASLGRERLRHLAYTTPLLRAVEPMLMGFHAATFWERANPSRERERVVVCISTDPSADSGQAAGREQRGLRNPAKSADAAFSVLSVYSVPAALAVRSEDSEESS